MERKVTLKDISEKIGISTAAVSKALRGHEGISEKTRQLVVETAKSLNYKIPPSPAPESDPAESPYTGLVIHTTNSGPHFSGIYFSIDKAFKNEGIYISDMKYTAPEDIAYIRDSSFDFLILVGRFSLHFAEQISGLDIPVFAIDEDHPFLNQDVVMSNDYQGSFEAVRHLVNHGHLRIGFVGDRHLSQSFRFRYNGYRDAMDYFGLEPNPACVYDLRFKDAYGNVDFGILTGHLDIGNLPTAFFCANDAIAYVLADILKSHQYKIPQDVSIIGFDDLESSKWQVPPLTTIHYPRESIGAIALELVKRRLKHNEDPKNVILVQTKLVQRHSVAPPPKQ